jgi:hypothetical protein
MGKSDRAGTRSGLEFALQLAMREQQQRYDIGFSGGRSGLALALPEVKQFQRRFRNSVPADRIHPI